MQLTENNKLDYIIYNLNKAKVVFDNDSIKKKGLLKEALKSRIEYYKSREKDLVNLSIEKLQNYSFQKDLADSYRNLSKVKEATTIMSKYFLKLEVHKYAPELNKAYFKKENKNLHVVSVKNCTNIEEVLNYLTTNFTSTEIASLHDNIKRY